jgi:hypothetical protein
MVRANTAATTLTSVRTVIPRYCPRTIDRRNNFGSEKKAASKKISSIFVDIKTIAAIPRSDGSISEGKIKKYSLGSLTV